MEEMMATIASNAEKAGFTSPNFIQQRIHLFAIGIAHAGAGKGLHVTLELIVRSSQHGHLHSELIQHPCEIGRLQPHATEISKTVGMQEYFISNRTEIHGPHGIHFAPSHDPLA